MAISDHRRLLLPDTTAEGVTVSTYLILFNADWVPELSDDQLRERGRAAMAVVDEMKSAGVYVFAEGVAGDALIGSVVAHESGPVFSPDPYGDPSHRLGGFTIVDVSDEDQARYWAERLAMAVGWPQELYRFPALPR